MQFINRIKETRDLVRIVNEHKDKNKLIVLYGTTGVGKTGLVSKLFKEDLIEHTSLRVQVSKSSPDTIENLHYLNSLYKVVWELARKKISDNIPTPLQQGVGSWKRIFQFAYGYARSKAGIETENRFFEPAEEQSVLRKKDYLINVFKKRSFIITIENVQNIDTQSFEMLFDILDKVSGINLVFEYTCESGDRQKLNNFINELDSINALQYHYEIKQLEFEEAKKLVPKYNSADYDDDVLKRKYKEGNGNLINMKMADPAMDPEENPIKYTLEMLRKEEKYIVNIIYLNEGKIDGVLLLKLLLHSKKSSIHLSHSVLSGIISNLEHRQIISFSGNILAINHDSIVTELENQKPSPTLFSVYSLLTSHYHTEKLRFPNDANNIEKLFSLYLKFSDESIFDILDDLKRIILQFKYPQNILAKLSHLREKLMSKPNANLKTVYELTLMMLEISYKMELLESAKENLNTIFVPDNPLHIAYQAGILAMNSADIKSREEIKLLILQAQEGSRLKLVLELILLAAMMEACNLSESKEYAERLLEVEHYETYLEYGFLLRNYAELVDISDSIEIYNRTISFFESFDRRDLQAQVYISLSMCHSYKGNLIISKEYLDKAVMITDKPLRENYLLNNYAVLDMLSGQFSEEVIKNLNDSLLLTSNEYEAIIIKCNLLICYVVSNVKEMAKQLCEEIENSGYEKYQYEELLHIVHQNLLFYYMNCNDLLKSEKHTYKIRALLYQDKLSDEVKHYVNLMLNGEKSEHYFYTQFPFRADFLGYWGFEINRELEHC
ncbi:hypothetical protein A8L34_12140 [Bacillus sp. FJAT-27264]|uniref:ATP-binding protein n=1 Tax=Paenibacillus sp. (strain DSM 101736 / FJAT-27264) TaxID=1850362 RepID=UPI000807E40E|nr:ATP-binding protein [Bacillus sp. FJAT-27264]OBZ14663.1 hypothetical protein A8L34_12140 [Bacillus sp. FJAT-27264]